MAHKSRTGRCHTQARYCDKVAERIREAIKLSSVLDGATEQELEFVGIQRVTVAHEWEPRATGANLVAALAEAGLRVQRVKGRHRFQGRERRPSRT